MYFDTHAHYDDKAFDEDTIKTVMLAKRYVDTQATKR